MKIWIAELILIYNDENSWETVFSFESNDREYKLNKRINGYMYDKGWIYDRIPITMEIKNTWSGLRVQQGFDRELNKEELKELESKMKSLLLKRLEIEKDEYLKTYENKVKSIGGIINGDR